MVNRIKDKFKLIEVVKDLSGLYKLPAEILGVCKKLRSYYLETHTSWIISCQRNLDTAFLAFYVDGVTPQFGADTEQIIIML